MMVLMIDDRPEILSSIKSIFGNKIECAECHNTSEALEAISRIQPEVILLDHQLTEGGSEGFEIIERISNNIKIYSTTSLSSAIKDYGEIGIEHIKKDDVLKIKSVIDG